MSQVSPGPVISALLADWEPEGLQAVKGARTVMERSEVAEAIICVLTRPQHVTIHDIVVLPTNLDA